MSLNRCESSFASEQSIEQKSLQREFTSDNTFKASYKNGTCTPQINSAVLPVHIPLVLLVQLNQILFFWVRTPVVCFKLLNISFSDLWFITKWRIWKQVYHNASGKGIANIQQIPSCTLFWKMHEDSEHLLPDPD